MSGHDIAGSASQWAFWRCVLNDFSYGAPEPLSTEEAAELANVMPPTLEEAYAEGRKDQREEDARRLEVAQRMADALNRLQERATLTNSNWWPRCSALDAEINSARAAHAEWEATR